MAKVFGGLLGRPQGKLANVVFSSARAREGKVVTARQLVKPSNPQTPDQQQQRSKFSEALAIVRKLGPAIYGEDWNRSIGQLPGFQSMMSVFLKALDSNNDLTVPPVIPLGDLQAPGLEDVRPGVTSQEVNIEHINTATPPAELTDTMVAFIIERDSQATPEARDVVVSTADPRSDEFVQITAGKGSTWYLAGIYARASNLNAPPLSPVEWMIGQSAPTV